MDKVFIYDPASVTADTLRVMQRKGYTCIALDADPQTFWDAIAATAATGVLVILSHGDENGPLAVAGTVGDDVDLAALAAAVGGRRFFLLSCHTGQNPCGATLTAAGLTFVAPLGTAVFETTGDETVTVKSMDGSEYPGWAGPLAPNRSNKALSLP